MDVNNPNISEKDRNSILNYIINCANCALQNEDAFQKAMLGLATALRKIFDSEYCSIGIVSGNYAEDYVTSLEKFEDEQLSKQQEIVLESVKHVSLDNNTPICHALKSEKNIYQPLPKDIERFGNYEQYQHILVSGKANNSNVIPIYDSQRNNFGFIQFINTKKSINFEQDILPFKDALLGLVQIIINNQKNQQELIKQNNRLKDAEFYNLMQDKRDNVNELLDSIMAYFSQEFNAAIVSFRIPLLDGYDKDPLFYLRRVFIHQSVGNNKSQQLINGYYIEQSVMHKRDMTVADELRCDLQGKIIESISYSDFSEYGLDLDEKTLIIPIFRDYDNQHKCISPSRKHDEYCKLIEHCDCTDRFKRLYGIFRLRISKVYLPEKSLNYYLDYNETKTRLSYLSKQITILLNSIVDRQVNVSLQVFQCKLKESSFIKIASFDESCVKIINNSVGSKVCSIYRYDKISKRLNLSATTASEIHFKEIGDIQTFSNLDKCFISITSTNNVLVEAFKAKRIKYIFNILDPKTHDAPFIENSRKILLGRYLSAMIVPMLNKEGECIGVVLLLGKEAHKYSISTAYWEHDIQHIEFIVNMLNRISESDEERLTFLSQLSHELLSPVTELVYDNDFTINIAERNPESITKQQLITKLKENIDRNMLFKYIICDTEFTYSSSGKNIEYNIIEQKKPSEILFSAIHLLEKEANFKGITIRTRVSEMPPMYFDKERMMQVFLNLLKNAIRYSDQFTTIYIFYNLCKKDNKDFHEIRFANFGIGIREEEKESIFELFHRGKEAKSKFVRGTGMGLYIVRNIMRSHGGDCYVCHLKNPTEFVITLPKN